MAETLRDLAALYANLADNNANLISAEDLRDAVESLRPRLGGFYFDDAGATTTTISVAGTYVKLAGSTVDIPDSHADWDHNPLSNDNRVIWKGAPTILGQFRGSVSLQVAAGSRPAIAACVAKNGVPIEDTKVSTTHASAGSTFRYNTSLDGFVSLALDDYLEVWVANLSATDNVKVYHGNLVVRNGLK